MTDREITEAIAHARAYLEGVDAELAIRRETDLADGFKVWSSVRLDALSLVHGLKRLDEAYTAALRRRRRARSGNRDCVAIRAERRS